MKPHTVSLTLGGSHEKSGARGDLGGGRPLEILCLFLRHVFCILLQGPSFGKLPDTLTALIQAQGLATEISKPLFPWA